jgi:hypothetical protein
MMNVTVRPALRPVCIFTTDSPGVVWLLPVTPSFDTHAARRTLGCAAVYDERGGPRRPTSEAVRLSLPWRCHSRHCFGRC